MAFATADQLIARATEATGLEDFGPDGWRPGLERMAEAMARLTFVPGGRENWEARMLGSLKARLGVVDWIARHPGYGEGEIEGPVIIHGLPRTATSALLNFLSIDPQWRYTRTWEVAEPVPPPRAETEQDDPRFAREKARMAKDTTFAAMHISSAGGPVDDAAILRMSFSNQEVGLPIWDYTAGWRDHDMRPAHAWHKTMLKYLQHDRGPNRWAVKAPWHNFHLDSLMETYPDAPFVWTHRDPVKVIGSVCSLVKLSYSTVVDMSTVDLKGLGEFMLEHLRISVERAMATRARHPEGRFIDVHHRAFNEDPIGTAKWLYPKLGQELTPEAEAEMRAWAEANRRGAHGAHSYASEDFGLTDARIADVFSDYIQAFDLRAKSPA